MFNSTSVPGPDSFVELRLRLLKRLRADKLNDQVLGVLRDAYESAFAPEHLVLSRVERKRLMGDVLKSVLEDVTRQLAEGEIPE